MSGTIVSEYSVDRLYGGPEEGGWWYDWWEFRRIVCIAKTEDDARHIADLLTEHDKKVKQENREPDRHSVIGTPDHIYMAEAEVGHHKSTEHPRYE